MSESDAVFLSFPLMCRTTEVSLRTLAAKAARARASRSDSIALKYPPLLLDLLEGFGGDNGGRDRGFLRGRELLDLRTCTMRLGVMGRI